MSRDSNEDAYIPEAEMTERISVFGYGQLFLQKLGQWQTERRMKDP